MSTHYIIFPVPRVGTLRQPISISQWPFDVCTCMHTNEMPSKRKGGRESIIEKSVGEKKREREAQVEIWMGSREKHRYN